MRDNRSEMGNKRTMKFKKGNKRMNNRISNIKLEKNQGNKREEISSKEIINSSK